MPASTFTIAVGQWLEAGVNAPNFEVEKTDETCVKVPRYVVHVMWLSVSLEKNIDCLGFFVDFGDLR